MLFEIDDSTSYPDDPTAFLEKSAEAFADWYLCRPGRSATHFDGLSRQLRDVVGPDSIRGYHCTRLTPHERN